MTADVPSGVDVYAVGLLRDLFKIRAALTPYTFRPQDKGPADWRQQVLRGTARCIRDSWLRGNYWNGYLAEPTVDVLWHRCGHGWTKRRALASLKRHIGEVQW